MTKLSDVKGFGAAGGGGGGGGGSSTFTGSLLTDFKSFNNNDAGWYMTITNLDAYAHPVRIRGLDTATKAYFGMNCAMTAGSGTGQMSHTFTLFSANQNTGAITRENVITVQGTPSTYDYSTFDRSSDEWTGRYTYSGNCPRTSSGHQYGFDTVLITGTTTTSESSDHTNTTAYYPISNSQKFNYVATAERRHGGAVKHTMPSYASSNSKATIVEWTYNYSTTSGYAAANQTPHGQSTTTSTNYTINTFWQWQDASEPYYDDFHSQPEGVWARNRSTGAWSNILPGQSVSQDYRGFHLSNGSVMLYLGGVGKLINSSGTISDLSSDAAATLSTLGPSRSGSYGSVAFCWNIGTDEWIQTLPGGKFIKFKLDPSTGAQTISNSLVVAELEYASLDDQFQYKKGFFSSFSVGSINYSSNSFTFGNESSSGNGYGRNKICFMGGSNSADQMFVATYDLTTLISTLSYS
tara:strand:- start:2236 stop:3630 length:1395 start_codon:yes stop_codon:yes gene_type:complete